MDPILHQYSIHLQGEDGKDSDWRSKWQRTAGAYWAQAEPNELATSGPDVNRSTNDATERINEAYFDSYGFFGIHREMISDKVTSPFWQPFVSVSFSFSMTHPSCNLVDLLPVSSTVFFYHYFTGSEDHCWEPCYRTQGLMSVFCIAGPH